MHTHKDTKDVEQQVSQLLTDKPEIKRAMDIFGIGMKEYTKAVSALTKKNIIITSTSTNGDMGGNQ